jgi:hypothetical protein
MEGSWREDGLYSLWVLGKMEGRWREDGPYSLWGIKEDGGIKEKVNIKN